MDSIRPGEGVFKQETAPTPAGRGRGRGNLQETVGLRSVGQSPCATPKLNLDERQPSVADIGRLRSIKPGFDLKILPDQQIWEEHQTILRLLNAPGLTEADRHQLIKHLKSLLDNLYLRTAKKLSLSMELTLSIHSSPALRVMSDDLKESFVNVTKRLAYQSVKLLEAQDLPSDKTLTLLKKFEEMVTGQLNPTEQSSLRVTLSNFSARNGDYVAAREYAQRPDRTNPEKLFLPETSEYAIRILEKWHGTVIDLPKLKDDISQLLRLKQSGYSSNKSPQAVLDQSQLALGRAEQAKKLYESWLVVCFRKGASFRDLEWVKGDLASNCYDNFNDSCKILGRLLMREDLDLRVVARDLPGVLQRIRDCLENFICRHREHASNAFDKTIRRLANGVCGRIHDIMSEFEDVNQRSEAQDEALSQADALIEFMKACDIELHKLQAKQSAKIIRLRATHLINHKRFEECQRWLDSWAGKDKEIAEETKLNLLQQQVSLLELQKRYVDTLPHLEALVDISDDKGKDMNTLRQMKVYWHQKDFEKAQEMLERVIAKDTVQFYAQKALLETSLGDDREAYNTLEKARSILAKEDFKPQECEQHRINSYYYHKRMAFLLDNITNMDEVPDWLSDEGRITRSDWVIEAYHHANVALDMDAKSDSPELVALIKKLKVK